MLAATSLVDSVRHGLDAAAIAWRDVCLRYPPGLIEVVGSAIAQVLGFLLPATVYLMIDLLFPKFSRKHKIQSHEKQPTGRQIVDCVLFALFNHAFLIGGHFIVLGVFRFRYSMFVIDPELPSPRIVLLDFVYAVLFREVLFYSVHRLLHHPRFYAWLHKKHHQFTAPISFAAVYSHPIDHLLQNAFPIAFPMIVRRAHFLSLMFFAHIVLWDAAAAHSGYDFFRLPAAECHDRHHEHWGLNYGVIGLMDWLMGTDKLGWEREKYAKPSEKQGDPERREAAAFD